MSDELYLCRVSQEINETASSEVQEFKYGFLIEGEYSDQKVHDLLLSMYAHLNSSLKYDEDNGWFIVTDHSIIRWEVESIFNDDDAKVLLEYLEVY